MMLRMSSFILILLTLMGNAMAKCPNQEQTLQGTVRVGFEKQVFIDSKTKKEYWIEEFSSDSNFPYDQKTAVVADYPATIQAKVNCKPVKIGKKTWSKSLVISKVLNRS